MISSSARSSSSNIARRRLHEQHGLNEREQEIATPVAHREIPCFHEGSRFPSMHNRYVDEDLGRRHEMLRSLGRQETHYASQRGEMSLTRDGQSEDERLQWQRLQQLQRRLKARQEELSLSLNSQLLRQEEQQDVLLCLRPPSYLAASKQYLPSQSFEGETSGSIGFSATALSTRERILLSRRGSNNQSLFAPLHRRTYAFDSPYTSMIASSRLESSSNSASGASTQIYNSPRSVEETWTQEKNHYETQLEAKIFVRDSARPACLSTSLYNQRHKSPHDEQPQPGPRLEQTSMYEGSSQKKKYRESSKNGVRPNGPTGARSTAWDFEFLAQQVRESTYHVEKQINNLHNFSRHAGHCPAMPPPQLAKHPPRNERVGVDILSTHKNHATQSPFDDMPNSSLEELIEKYTFGGRKEPPFPLKLHAMLTNPQNQGIIGWRPDGKSWKIFHITLFEEVLVPRYFRHGKYSSFMRQGKKD